MKTIVKNPMLSDHDNISNTSPTTADPTVTSPREQATSFEEEELE